MIKYSDFSVKIKIYSRLFIKLYKYAVFMQNSVRRNNTLDFPVKIVKYRY